MAIKALGEMSISEAHEILDAFWREAGKHDWIFDRTAWALYMTYKQADARTFSARYLKKKKEESGGK